MHRPWRRHSPFRSRSGSPQQRHPLSPQVSSPPGTPPPSYSHSMGGQSPTSTQGGPPIVRSKTRDLPSILVADTPQWRMRFKKVPDMHKRFLMQVCSLIVNTAELAQFAKGCGISDYTISRAAMYNLGNDGECIDKHYAGGGCIPTPTHDIKPIRLNWGLINWIAQVSMALC